MYLCNAFKRISDDAQRVFMLTSAQQTVRLITYYVDSSKIDSIITN